MFHGFHVFSCLEKFLSREKMQLKCFLYAKCAVFCRSMEFLNNLLHGAAPAESSENRDNIDPFNDFLKAMHYH